MPPLAAAEFRTDLGLATDAVRLAIDPNYAKRKDAHWIIWIQFCTKCNLDPFLANIQDPIPYLQVFAQRYRDGTIAPRGNVVSAKYIRDVLCSIGQAFSILGAPDPRLTALDGSVDFRLRRMYKFYDKSDPPPARVKPVPITFILFLLNTAYGLDHNAVSASPTQKALADMTCVAFYFLLRPSEYSGPPNRQHAVFSLDDVHVYIGQRKLDLATALECDVVAATNVRLHYTTQKNQRKGDVIAHACSQHPYCCPVKALLRLILTHRRWFATRGIPYDGKVRLASYYRNDERVNLRPEDVTRQLRYAARVLFHTSGIAPNAITARSCRAGGAMALLCGGCDDNIIQLLGRWNGASMLRYLHQEAEPIMRNLAAKMFNHGDYSFLPTASVPM